ncbi:MAG: TlpA family protein disulfide reductase [Chitinophagaceae bacterium]|nr:MAG: TlpA family protein disulfide reductase [Chitinophagaceae bacterium]
MKRTARSPSPAIIPDRDCAPGSKSSSHNNGDCMKKIMTKLFLCLAFSAISVAAGAQGTVVPKWKTGDLERYMDTTSVPTVINFWATFCKPCIAEIPHFQELTAQYENEGVRLLLVSLDLPEDYKKIPAFMQKRKVTAPVAFLDESNADLFCPKVDKSWSGALPATLFLNKHSGYRHFIEDALTRAQLENELKKLVQ